MKSDLWAMDPACVRVSPDGSRSGRQVRPIPMILYRTMAPTCQGCGETVLWSGPPTKRRITSYLTEKVTRRVEWVYRIVCRCGEDEIVSPDRLLVGGNDEFWLGLGWYLRA